MSPAVTIAGLSDFREIGRGGFAVVYRAHQDNVARPVAVKVLASLDLDLDQQRRFRQECRAMGALSGHPNIVQVFDIGTTDQGHAYIVMELMVGGSLWQRVKTHGPVPADAILAIGVELCGALESAHRGGILHRDVKPENVLIDAGGTARLADFGIATTTSGTRSITGAFAGTIAYLPPELVNGDKATVQADIYALGATLYALASARAPFVRATDQTPVSAIARILHDEPDDLGPLGIPGPLTAVIATAMAKIPANRYPTASVMGDALRSAQQQLGQPPTRLVIIEPAPFVGDLSDTIRRAPPRHEMGTTAALGATYDDRATIVRPAPAPQPGLPGPRTKRSRLVIAAAFTVAALVVAAATTVAWNLTSKTTSAARPTTAPPVTATTQVPTSTTTSPPPTTTPTPPLVATAPGTAALISTTATSLSPSGGGAGAGAVAGARAVRRLANSAIAVAATSSLPPEPGCGGSCTYEASNVLDGDPATAWAEGAAGFGIGESLTFSFDRRYTFSSLELSPGWDRADIPCLYVRNGRPKLVSVQVDHGAAVLLSIEDRAVPQTLPLPGSGSTVTLTIDEVYAGQACGTGAPAQDTLISEVSFDVEG